MICLSASALQLRIVKRSSALTAKAALRQAFGEGAFLLAQAESRSRDGLLAYPSGGTDAVLKWDRSGEERSGVGAAFQRSPTARNLAPA